MGRNKSRRAPQQRAAAPAQRGTVALVEPRGYVALGDEGRAAGARLQEATAALAALEEKRSEEVARLRALGASWAVVGWLLGITGEAARKRWGTP